MERYLATKGAYECKELTFSVIGHTRDQATDVCCIEDRGYQGSCLLSGNEGKRSAHLLQSLSVLAQYNMGQEYTIHSVTLRVAPISTSFK